jgi:hypothetical protein
MAGKHVSLGFRTLGRIHAPYFLDRASLVPVHLNILVAMKEEVPKFVCQYKPRFRIVLAGCPVERLTIDA